MSTDPQSRLSRLRQTGSLKVLFPRNDASGLQTVLVNTAGGLTGGDEFSFRAKAASGSTLTITTQAAERAYRAQTDQTAKVTNRVTLDEKARVNWLPQETILFENSSLVRSLRVDMSGTSDLLLAEPIVFGRAAMGERLNSASFQDRIEIWRDDELLFLDAMNLSGDIHAKLKRIGRGTEIGALVSLIYVAPDAETKLGEVRALLPESGGASLIRDTVLFLRCVATDSFELRQSLMPILRHLSGETLPRPWML